MAVWHWCPWPCVSTAHHDREWVLLEKAAHLMVTEKQRDRKGPGSQHPFKSTLPVTWLLPMKLHLLKFPLPPNSATGCWHIGLLRTFQIQAIAFRQLGRACLFPWDSLQIAYDISAYISLSTPWSSLIPFLLPHQLTTTFMSLQAKLAMERAIPSQTAMCAAKNWW
jgi:hypothetical protein